MWRSRHDVTYTPLSWDDVTEALSHDSLNELWDDNVTKQCCWGRRQAARTELDQLPPLKNASLLERWLPFPLALSLPQWGAWWSWAELWATACCWWSQPRSSLATRRWALTLSVSSSATWQWRTSAHCSTGQYCSFSTWSLAIILSSTRPTAWPQPSSVSAVTSWVARKTGQSVFFFFFFRGLWKVHCGGKDWHLLILPPLFRSFCLYSLRIMRPNSWMKPTKENS